MSADRLEYFERLWEAQQWRPLDKRLIWIRGFQDALEVSGCLQMELRKRVNEATEEILDAVVNAGNKPPRETRSA